MMRNLRMTWWALASLVIAALACALPGAGSGGTSPLFKDDFSRTGGGWATISNDQGSIDYVEDALVFKISEAQYIFRSTPSKKFSDIHVEVTARNTGEAEDPGFGLLCHYVDEDNFYFLGIGSDGLYAIGKKEKGDYSILSSTDDTWTSSDQLAVKAEQYHLGADCGKGKLTLYVDGKEINSVDDTTFTEGEPGLFAQTAEAPNAEIRFDDFIVTKLSQ